MPIFIKTEIIKKEYLIQKDIRKKVINEHIQWIENLIIRNKDKQSQEVVNELKKPGDGGLLILDIETYQAALEIVKQAPMIKNNIVEWKLNEWIDITQ